MDSKIQHLVLPPLGSLSKYRSSVDSYLTALPSGTSASLLLLGAQQILLIFALGFTSRNSTLRLGLFLPVILFTLLGLAIYKETPVTSSAVLMIVIPLGAASQVLQYISLVLIRGWSFEDREKVFPSSSKSTSTEQESSWLAKLKFGLYAAYSFRYCGTPYEVGVVTQYNKNNIAPTKKQFLFRTGTIVLINFLIMDFVSYFSSGTEPNPAFAQIHVPFFSRLHEITTAEIFERTIIVALLYASNVGLLTITFGVVGFISVATGLSEPSRWKPAFNYDHGLPYSVRRFWSHFWHVSMKDRIYTPSKSIVDDILHLPKGSLLRRYALIWLTFIASGLFHIVGEVGAGVPFSEDGSFFYYTAQAGAIMAEDLVSYLWNRRYHQGDDEKRVTTPAWHFWVGKVWLCLWMVWITPGWFYPTNRLTTGIPVFPFGSPTRAIMSRL